MPSHSGPLGNKFVCLSEQELKVSEYTWIFINIRMRLEAAGNYPDSRYPDTSE